MLLYEELKKKENKKSFRELVMKYHPDKKGGSEEMMKKLNNAADKGDAAFERFLEEITGRGSSPAEKLRRMRKADWKPKDEEVSIDEFKEMLEKELRGHPEVVSIRTFKSPGPETPFVIDLKDGRHIQISYIDAPASPSIGIWMINKKNIPLEWKMEGDKWRQDLYVRSVGAAKNAIKNLLKVKDFREPKDEDDPYENMERETYRDSRR